MLDGYHELERQEIYFASLSELNDPMEGFTDILWQGDRIVWSNLLRHYIVCLDHACAFVAVAGEAQRIGWQDIPMVRLDATVAPQRRVLEEAILTEFLDDESVRSFVEALSSRSQPVRRNELSVYLRHLHTLALAIIYDCYERYGQMPKQPSIAELRQKGRKIVAEVARSLPLMNQVEAEHPHMEFSTDSIFLFQRLMLDQLRLIHLYNGTVDGTKANKNFLFVDFPDEYVREIEKLIYPRWYTACFMASCHDSSVWGNYGDRHQGVCLRFKVGSKGGLPAIRVNRIHGFTGDQDIVGPVDHQFYPVEYTKHHAPVDFFRSMRLPIPTLKSAWFSDRQGNISPIGQPLFSNLREWRERWRRDFMRGATCKLEAWNREEEYRLILAEGMLDYSTKERRKAKYDFHDLDGIIFGINTPTEKKLEISKIDETKCRQYNKFDITFYQAYYSREKGTIDHHELRFLKFTAN